MSERARRFRRNAWKYPWDDVDWAGQSNADIAASLGCSGAQVAMVRKRQGRPEGPDGHRVPDHLKKKYTPTGKPLGWKAREAREKNEAKILDFLSYVGRATRREIQVATSINQYTVRDRLRSLIESGDVMIWPTEYPLQRPFYQLNPTQYQLSEVEK